MLWDEVRARWIDKRDSFEKYDSTVNAVKIIEDFIADLERLAETAGEELLSISEAARLSGYSAGHLRRLVRERRLRNFGRRCAPKIRREDLPCKSGYLTDAARNHILPKAQIARSIVHSTASNDD